MKSYKILTINPGSTSTKIGVFQDEECLLEINLSHSLKELESFDEVWEQYTFRKKEIISELEKNNFPPSKFDAVVGRGGLIKPIPSGVYYIDQEMIEDARCGYQGHHASNLGCVIAYSIGWEFGVPAFIVDPPAVNDLEEIAKISGNKHFERGSLLHALNIFATGRKYAKSIFRKFKELNLIVAHMGGGITVAALKKGKAINVNNGLDEGPFTPERSGQLPLLQFMEYCFSGKYTKAQLKKMIVGNGGLTSYFNTNKAKDIETLAGEGSLQHKLVYNAMAYQIAEEIGKRATNLSGKIDAIILTGGIAHSKLMTSMISERTSFMAPVILFPGELELEALASGALRVLKGEEQPKQYTQKIKKIGIIYWDNIDVYTTAIDIIETELLKAGYIFRKNDNNLIINYVNCKKEEGKVINGIQTFRDKKVDLIFAIGSPISMRLGHYMKNDAIPIVFTGIYSPAVISEFHYQRNQNYYATCYAPGIKDVLENTVYKITPEIKVIGLLYKRGELQSEIQFDELKTIAQLRNIEIASYEVETPVDFKKAKQFFVKNNVEWIFMGTSITIASTLAEELAIFTENFPTICLLEDTVLDGGLIGYVIPWKEVCLEATNLALQIFNGEKILKNVSIPQQKKIVANKTTAQTIGLLPEIMKLKEVKFL